MDVVVVLFVLFLLATVSAFTLQDTYILGEPVYFEVCDDADVAISCLDSFDRKQWDNGCSIIAFDSDDLTCDNPRIAIRGDRRDDRFQTRIPHYERSLRSQLISHTATEDPVELAKQIYARALLNESYDEFVDALQFARSEEFKCWPAGACRLDTTAKVLYYLSEAGVNRTVRIYHDALLWIESRQNPRENEGWELEIIGRNETMCEVKLDTSVLTTIVLDNDGDRRGPNSGFYTFDFDANRDLNITCNDTVDIRLWDYFYELKFEDRAKNVSIHVQSGCWPHYPTSRPLDCPLGLTERIMLLRDINEDVHEKGVEWMENEIDRAQVAGQRHRQTTSLLHNINLYSSVNASLVRSWIMFSQSNDGSFARDPILTLRAVRVFNDSNAWTRDAIRWLHLNRPDGGWGDVESASLEFELFQSNKTIIKTSPLIVTEEGFAITANSTINVSEELSEIIELDITDDWVDINFLINREGVYRGSILINGREVPAVITIPTFLDIYFDEEYYLVHSEGVLDVPMRSSSSNLTCSLTFSDVFETMTVSGDGLSLFYDFSEPFDDVITVHQECPHGNESYAFMLRHGPAPFEVTVRNHVIDGKGTVRIANMLERQINVYVLWEEEIPEYMLYNLIPLVEGERADVNIFQSMPSDFIGEQDAVLVVSTLGYVEHIPLTVVLGEDYYDLEAYVVTQRFPLMQVLYGTIIISLIMLGFLMVLSSRKKKNAPSVTKSKKKKKSIVKNSLAKVVVAIDKTLGENEDEIAKELSQEGFTQKEILRLLDATTASINAVGDSDAGEKSEGTGSDTQKSGAGKEEK